MLAAKKTRTNTNVTEPRSNPPRAESKKGTSPVNLSRPVLTVLRFFIWFNCNDMCYIISIACIDVSQCFNNGWHVTAMQRSLEFGRFSRSTLGRHCHPRKREGSPAGEKWPDEVNTLAAQIPETREQERASGKNVPDSDDSPLAPGC
jgi:hypothetical protein